MVYGVPEELMARVSAPHLFQPERRHQGFPRQHCYPGMGPAGLGDAGAVRPNAAQGLPRRGTAVRH